jgi:Arc/MetJ-type ribon-helix-helix transcriptional regulator
MRIEITSPEIEALIEQRLKTGAFTNEQDVILHALRATEPTRPTGANLVAAMQASPFPEIEIEPARERMPVRDTAC